MDEHRMPAFASPVDYEKYGRYVRLREGKIVSGQDYSSNQFRGRISADGSTPYAPEVGRYHLYLAIGCPWAQRTAIGINLLGLKEAVSYSFVDDVRDGRGWAFREPHGPDPVNNYRLLKEAYLATAPGFEGHVNVPTLWDRNTSRVVNNDDEDILIDLLTQFGSIATTAIDLYPASLRADMEAFDADLHAKVNIGVYRAGVSLKRKDQHGYELAVRQVFETLNALEDRLETRRYVWGNEITESDIRLYVTLVRFDPVYNQLFKVNLRRLVDYPRLWAYTRDLYSVPAFRELSDFDAFKLMYYRDFPLLDPTGILPAGPILDWDEPQRRASLSAGTLE